MEGEGLWASTMESIALFFLPTTAKSFSTLFAAVMCVVRASAARVTRWLQEDGDGTVNLLAATEAAEHRRGLAVTILDVDKCDERKFHHFLMGQPLGSSMRS